MNKDGIPRRAVDMGGLMGGEERRVRNGGATAMWQSRYGAHASVLRSKARTERVRDGRRRVPENAGVRAAMVNAARANDGENASHSRRQPYKQHDSPGASTRREGAACWIYIRATRSEANALETSPRREMSLRRGMSAISLTN